MSSNSKWARIYQENYQDKLTSQNCLMSKEFKSTLRCRFTVGTTTSHWRQWIGDFNDSCVITILMHFLSHHSNLDISQTLGEEEAFKVIVEVYGCLGFESAVEILHWVGIGWNVFRGGGVDLFFNPEYLRKMEQRNVSAQFEYFFLFKILKSSYNISISRKKEFRQRVTLSLHDLKYYPRSMHWGIHQTRS